MKLPKSRSALAWALFWLAAAVLVVQAASLVQRGNKEESDIGVFYRTGMLLDKGASGEIYTQRDSVTGWPIAIPPAGTLFFQSFVRYGPLFLSAVWALLNLLFAVLALLALRGLCVQFGGFPLELFPWLGAAFLLLAGGSVQVGQFSLMFAACWIGALWLIAKGRMASSSLLWAVPAAIKVYPLLLFAAPLAGSPDRRAFVRRCWMLIASLALVFVAVPFLFYGSRAWSLETSFVERIVLDPHGRMKWMQALGTTANQGLDAVLIRYLSYYPKFHDAYTWVPTLRWDLNAVRALGNALRVVVVVITLVCVVRFRRRTPVPTLEELIALTGVWSATLYVSLPETRARYAVYAFLGLVPFMLLAVRAKGEKQFWGLCAALTVCFLLVLGAVPYPLDVLGVGFLGSLGLWLAGLKWLKVGPKSEVAK